MRERRQTHLRLLRLTSKIKIKRSELGREERKREPIWLRQKQSGIPSLKEFGRVIQGAMMGDKGKGAVLSVSLRKNL